MHIYGSVDVLLTSLYRYYIERADSPQTRRASALIHRSYFRPLTRVRYDLIGQDRVLEQLFRVLSMPSMAPIVVLLCGTYHTISSMITDAHLRFTQGQVATERVCLRANVSG